LAISPDRPSAIWQIFGNPFHLLLDNSKAAIQTASDRKN
jgi:hypothetical protein